MSRASTPSPPIASRDSELTISSFNPPPTPKPTSPRIAGVSPSSRSTPPTPTTTRPPLPPGCRYGLLPPASNIPRTPSESPEEEKRRRDDKDARRVIWVDFPPSSRENPFFFSKARKRAILVAAIFFTGMTAFNTSSYAIGEDSMRRDLGLTATQASAGLAIYAWGFGIAPLVLAPLSEEFGRRWTCIVSVFVFWQCHLFLSLGKNLATVLVGRFLQGAAGSVGATLVGGTISDIYIPSERGVPMAAFGAVAIGSTGLGPVMMAWVEANTKLEWRWIQWIQYIIMGAYMPIIYFVLCETRATVILRRRAHHYRHTLTGFSARFTSRSEIEKVKISVAIQQSLMRPITFLFVEPVVTFFSLWVGLCWGVFYIQIAGLPYVYQNIFGFSITSVGLVYIAMVIGAVVGFIWNFGNEALYQRYKEQKGVEARLYVPMLAGITFAIGCFIFAFTSVPHVHWIGPCFGIVIIIASVLIIYITNFTYLSECYGSYASSAIAAQSFLRNMFGGAFTFLTKPLFDSLTVRWGLFLFGCISAVLAVVPFVAFFYGPQIRARSKYSRQLMAEEARRIEVEKHGEADAGDGALEPGDGEEGETLDERVMETEKRQRPQRQTSLEGTV